MRNSCALSTECLGKSYVSSVTLHYGLSEKCLQCSERLNHKNHTVISRLAEINKQIIIQIIL